MVFISYPKSGRTWVRVIMDYLGINARYDHDAANIAYHPDKDYSDFDIDKEKYADKRIILIIRDPRDTVVSSYFHAVYRQKIFNGTLSEFISDRKFGLYKILDFQKTWIHGGGAGREFFIIRYEDLHKDAANTFKSILNFLGADNISDRKLKNTIDMFSFENMKALEQKGVFRLRYGKILKPADTSNKNSYKVRKGKVGGYKEYLSPEDIEYCEKLMKETDLEYYKV